jgi:uncharacterized protein
MSDDVVRIAELNIYPVKGCRGISLRSAELAATGLMVDGIGDREWLIVDGDGEFLSQREIPEMSLIDTRLVAEALRLKAPGMLELELPFASEGDVLRVQVWDDTISAVTQGELADAWVSRYLGRPARLVRFDYEHTRLASHQYTGKLDAPYKFADAFPLLITGTDSLADLNCRLARAGHPAVTMARFRANIVLDGLPAYEEDHVRTLRAGDVELRLVKPCARCTVPGVDPGTGAASPIVPDLLASYRRRDSGSASGVMFGVNAVVAAGAGSRLKVGDPFEVELDF